MPSLFSFTLSHVFISQTLMMMSPSQHPWPPSYLPHLWPSSLYCDHHKTSVFHLTIWL
ncbi:hypothetical protein HanLR1_Chr17g0679891 [Helianthus annuus]|nr:hypothetical protein HanLR1_Chr17g0679891 [Helianthus annuus]